MNRIIRSLAKEMDLTFIPLWPDLLDAAKLYSYPEITVDGIISADEVNDFKRINDHLSEISKTVSSLQLWIQQAMIDNKIADIADND